MATCLHTIGGDDPISVALRSARGTCISMGAGAGRRHRAVDRRLALIHDVCLPGGSLAAA
jgi:hypothetical protein